MTRRRYPHYRKPFAPAQAALTPDSGVRALVWLDMEPLLGFERWRCEKASDDLERAKEQLEQFRTEWEPAFSRWFHGNFGESLTRVRELESQAERMERIVMNVRAEAMMSGCSERAAYERLQRMSDGAEQLEEMRSRHQAGASDSSDSRDGGPKNDSGINTEDGVPPEAEAFLRMGFEQLFGRNRFSPEEYARMFEGFKKSFLEDLVQAQGSARRRRRERT